MLGAKLRRELAVHGRAMHADLLEHPSVHDRHHAAAAWMPVWSVAAMACARSGRRGEIRCRRLRPRGFRTRRRCRRAAARTSRGRVTFRSSMSAAQRQVVQALGWCGPVCRKASPSAIAAAMATLRERRPPCMGIRSRVVGGGEHVIRDAGRLSRPNSRMSAGRSCSPDMTGRPGSSAAAGAGRRPAARIRTPARPHGGRL